MSLPLDCYIVDQSKAIHGPMDAQKAHQMLESLAFGCLLLRAGFAPVWSEDIEGIEIVLGKGTTPARLIPRAPSSRIMVRKNLFDGSRPFDVSCTAQYHDHREWFENQKKLRADFAHSEVSEINSHGKDGPGRFATTMIGPSRKVIGSVLAVLVGFGLIVLSSQQANWRNWGFFRAKDAVSDVFAPAPQLIFAENSRSQSLGEVSFQARDSIGNQLLNSAIERKLGGDGEGFLLATLDVMNRSDLFKSPVLPSMERLAAIELALFSQSIAVPSREVDELGPLLKVARAYATSLAAISSNVRFDLAPSTSYELSLVGEKIDRDELGSELTYWGNKRAELGDEIALVPEAVISQSLNQMLVSAPQVRDGDHLRSWFIARTLYFALIYSAGNGDVQGARNIQALSENLMPFVRDDDRKILSLLTSEAQRSYDVEDLPFRVSARVKLLGKMQAENDFLCRPSRSALGSEFLIQSMRMANAIGAELPGLDGVFGDCFVQPTVLLPGTQRDTLGRPEELLEYTPTGADGFTPEWNRFAATISTRVLSDQSKLPPGTFLHGVSSDRQWQWRSLVAFSSTDAGLREGMASVFEGQCRENWEAMKFDGTPLCLVSFWNRKNGLLIAQRRQLLSEIQSRYGRLDASEAFFQWLVWAYVTPNVLPGEPGNPLQFAEKNQMRSLLDTDRPQLGALDWYVRTKGLK